MCEVWVTTGKGNCTTYCRIFTGHWFWCGYSILEAKWASKTYASQQQGEQIFTNEMKMNVDKYKQETFA